VYYVYEFDPETGDPVSSEPIDEYTTLVEAKEDARGYSVREGTEVAVVSFGESDEDGHEITRYRCGKEV